MSLLLKVRQNVPQLQSIKNLFRHVLVKNTSHADQCIRSLFRGPQIALSGKTPFDVIHKHEIITLRHYKMRLIPLLLNTAYL